MTLLQLADAIGATKGHMSNIETGRSNLLPATADAIARHLGITVEMLWHKAPGDEEDPGDELLALFRAASPETRKAILITARAVVALDRRS